MGLCFRVITGPLSGQVVEIKEEMKIGRDQGDLILEDKKVSGLHAYVQQNESGQLVLVDNGSKNGIKINDRRMDQVVLEPGIELELGNSRLEVFWQTQQAAEKAETHGQTSTKTPRRKTWSEVLVKFTEQLMEKAEDAPTSELKAFSPALHLTFITGLQMDTFWRLGYGPRKIGALSLDLPVFEPKAPDLCFQISPGPQGPFFTTEYPDVVKVNGAGLKEAELKKGDIISIYDTSLEVDFDQ